MTGLDLDALAAKALNCELPTREEALAVLASSDDDLMDVVAAAFRVRRRFFGRRVKLNYLVNIKSGLCPEDCFYCSQRVGSGADVLKYSWLKTDEVIASAEAGVAGGARRVCLVASGRGPTDKDIDRVASTIASFKARNPDVEVCACLGLLSDGQAERLAEAGTTAYNHNLNTSGGHYADICTTHEYADRVSTVSAAKAAGLSPCSGLIAGMGETDADLVDVAFALRAMSPDSVPVNFLIPFDGTPLAGQWTLTPQRCLRILAMVRFVCPSAEVRLAGGREIHLRTLQPLALHIVNSIFLGDYLTSEGQPGAADLAMIADAGFTVEGAENIGNAAPANAAPTNAAPTNAPTLNAAIVNAATANAAAANAANGEAATGNAVTRDAANGGAAGVNAATINAAAVNAAAVNAAAVNAATGGAANGHAQDAQPAGNPAAAPLALDVVEADAPTPPAPSATSAPVATLTSNAAPASVSTPVTPATPAKLATPATSATSATPATPATSATPASSATPGTPRPDLVHLRRRGAGTTLPANT